MKKVAIITCRVLPEKDADQELLLGALRKAGLEPSMLAWDDPAADPAGHDLCVIRSCWDYFKHPGSFLKWIERADKTSRLMNTAPVVRWNHHKRYLAELASAGVPVVPTVFFERGEEAVLGTIMATRKWDDVVIKPSVSASSFRTKRFARADAKEGQEFLRELLRDRDAMVQKYMPAVEGEGEKAIVWIDGEFTHSVRKSARFAGSDEKVSAAKKITGEELALAEQALGKVRKLAGSRDSLLYARIDMVRGLDGIFAVSEIELIEPSLFLLQHPPALERLVAAIEKYSDGKAIAPTAEAALPAGSGPDGSETINAGSDKHSAGAPASGTSKPGERKFGARTPSGRKPLGWKPTGRKSGGRKLTGGTTGEGRPRSEGRPSGEGRSTGERRPSGEGRPSGGRPPERRSGEWKPRDRKPGEWKPSGPRSSDRKTGEWKPRGPRSDDRKSGGWKPSGPRSGERKPGEWKSRGPRSDDRKPGGWKPRGTGSDDRTSGGWNPSAPQSSEHRPGTWKPASERPGYRTPGESIPPVQKSGDRKTGGWKPRTGRPDDRKGGGWKPASERPGYRKEGGWKPASEKPGYRTPGGWKPSGPKSGDRDPGVWKPPGESSGYRKPGDWKPLGPKSSARKSGVAWKPTNQKPGDRKTGDRKPSGPKPPGRKPGPRKPGGKKSP